MAETEFRVDRDEEGVKLTAIDEDDELIVYTLRDEDAVLLGVALVDIVPEEFQ